ncbi:MAG: hypothetical protein K8F31_11520, partial [Roseovarius sp.]|nr:hypothetical protein [Roseovarius sp.]
SAAAASKASLSTSRTDDGDTAMIEMGALVKSADGMTIGTVAGTRSDTKDGSLQAIVELEPTVGLPVTKLALETRDLAIGTGGALTYDITMANLRSQVNAQVGTGATSMSN